MDVAQIELNTKNNFITLVYVNLKTNLHIGNENTNYYLSREN